MKYVIYRSALFIDAAILFCEVDPHATFQHLNPISAGYCRIAKDINDQFVVHVWGESNTLQLVAREEDANIIKQTLTFRS